MFEVGQKVLCIDDRPDAFRNAGISPTGTGDSVVAGCVYTITEIREGFVKRNIFFRFRELKHGEGMGYYYKRFRPIDDPSLEIFREMTRKPPVKIDEEIE